jgi:hypothetical protein
MAVNRMNTMFYKKNPLVPTVSLMHHEWFTNEKVHEKTAVKAFSTEFSTSFSTESVEKKIKGF